MRLFIAIDFAQELRESLYQATAALRTAAPGIRWTPAEKLHLTLKFLGEQTAAVEERLRPALDDVAARHGVMELVLDGVGAFPGFRRARVVWTGILPNPLLAHLYDDVDAACERLGAPRETRPFRPHVTLGRVRPGTSPDQLAALARVAETLRVHGVSRVETLDLMESVSGGGGARYVTRHSAPLGR